MNTLQDKLKNYIGAYEEKNGVEVCENARQKLKLKKKYYKLCTNKQTG